MAFSTVLDTAQIEETKRLIAEHTAHIIGNISSDNNTYNAMRRIQERSKAANDPDTTIAGMKAYFADRMGATISDKLNVCTFTHAFMQTGLNLVDWYAVLSYLTEIDNDLDRHPF